MERVVETGAPAFGVRGRHSAGVTVLTAVGRLVAGVGAADPMWQTSRDWRGATRLVVDLAGVTALDAGGVGALLRLRQSAARAGVPVTVAAAAPRVRRVLQLLRLDAVFELNDGLVPGTEHRSVPGTSLAPLCRCA